MKYQRQIDLLQYINNKGTVSIAELLEHFHISKATLNRDLTDLEKEESFHAVAKEFDRLLDQLEKELENLENNK